jgi:hypothetical protein
MGQAAVKLARKLSRLTVVRHPILRLVLRAKRQAMLQPTCRMYTWIWVQLGCAKDFLCSGHRFTVGATPSWLASGPRWALAWASHRPMMGPRLGPHGPMMGPSLGPQWAHDGHGPMSRAMTVGETLLATGLSKPAAVEAGFLPDERILPEVAEVWSLEASMSCRSSAP